MAFRAWVNLSYADCKSELGVVGLLQCRNQTGVIGKIVFCENEVADCSMSMPRGAGLHYSPTVRTSAVSRTVYIRWSRPAHL